MWGMNIDGGATIGDENDWGSVLAGYKYMDFDYDNGLNGNNHYAYDAKQQGPLLGLTIRW